MKIKILIPIYNDWRSVFELLKQIDNQISDISDEISILIVNDGSNEEKENIPELKYIKSVKILNMKQNQGHARCNAVGLKYLYENDEFDYLIPMDGDGEDRPEEIKLLLEKSKD